MYRPAVSAAVADLIKSEDRVRAYGMLYWAINLGFAIATAVAGIFAGFGGYRYLFYLDALTSVIFAGVIWRWIPESRPERSTSQERVRFSVPFRDPLLIGFASLSLLIVLMFFQIHVTLPSDMRNHGVSATAFGLILALNGVLIVVLQPFIAPLIQGWRPSYMLAVSALLTGLGFGIYGFAGGVAVYVIGMTVMTLGEIIGNPFVMSTVAKLAPPSLRGSYQGAFQMMSWGLASLVGPTIGSWVYGGFGARVLWAGCVGAGVLGMAGHLVFTRKIDQNSS